MSEPAVTSRRALLCCAAVLAAGGGAVAVTGCSSSTGTSGESSGGSAGGAASGPSGAAHTNAAPSGGGTSVDLGAAGDIPVGGGKVFREKKIVVTQPSAGQYKAFSAKCTHAGCLVDQVKNNQIQCPCHGSRFGSTDGAVQDGPAPKPLPEYPVTVQNGNLQVTTA